MLKDVGMTCQKVEKQVQCLWPRISLVMWIAEEPKLSVVVQYSYKGIISNAFYTPQTS